MVHKLRTMLALATILVSLSDILALDSNVRRRQSMMSETTRDLKKKNEKCITGTSAVVNDWCKTNNCCKGGAYCDTNGADVLTICENSCNGEEACFRVGEGVVIHSGSCLGLRSCKLIGDGALIAAGACVGKWACYGVGDSAATEITIGAGACKGVEACDEMGFSGDSTKIAIGAGACQGKQSCNNMGEFFATSICIAKNACASKLSCNECEPTTAGPLSIKGQTCPV